MFMSANLDPLRLTPDQLQLLTELAIATGRSAGDLMQEALAGLQQRLAGPPADSQPRSAYEACVEAGLLGCLRSGLGDLSTNPRYLDGFGASE